MTRLHVNVEALNLRGYAPERTQIVTYGLQAETQPKDTPGAVDWTVSDIEVHGAQQSFTAHYRGERFGRFTISLPGRRRKFRSPRSSMPATVAPLSSSTQAVTAGSI